jgi:DnaJ domain
MPYRCYYAVLQVSRSATQDVIESAYKRLAREIHPDKNRSAASHSEMQSLNEAYEVLSNPARRRVYDDHTRVYRPASSEPTSKSRRVTSRLNEVDAVHLAQRLAARWLSIAQIIQALEKRGVDRGMAVFIVFARTDAPRRSQWQEGLSEMIAGGMILLLAAAFAVFIYFRAETASWQLELDKFSWSSKFIMPLLVATVGGVKFLRGMFRSAKA